MYCIDKDILLHLKSLVFDRDVEYCSLFEEGDIVDGHQKLEYSFQEEREGIKLNNRQGCATEKIGIYKVRSHPFGEHSYPSPEDLMVMVKHRFIKLSVIATNWGVYMIKQNGKKLNYYDTLKDRIEEVMNDLNEFLLREIEPIESYLGGRETPHQLNYVVIPDVNTRFDFLGDDLGLDIKIYPWFELNLDKKRERENEDTDADKPKIKRKRKM